MYVALSYWICSNLFNISNNFTKCSLLAQKKIISYGLKKIVIVVNLLKNIL